MIFNNLESVLENEQNIYEAINNTVLNIGSKPKKSSKISKLLQTLSHYGMNYSDDVYNNMYAIPANEDFVKKDEEQLTPYNAWTTNWKEKGDEEKSFTEKTIEEKRNILRKLAYEPELEDILNKMTNESIVYDDKFNYVCNPYIDNSVLELLNEKASKEIKKTIDTIFYKIYELLNWKEDAWNIFKRWLIEGVLAYEIVPDDISHPHYVMGIVELDAATLTRKFEDGMYYWYQFKGIQGKERRLLDAQIIYIKYEDTGSINRQSYLERLIRPFNIYRIVEQAQVIWTVTQSSFKTKFTIPIGGLSRIKGTQTLNEAMNRYREDIKFNTETGELKVNGKVNMPFNKEYWLPNNEQGTPEIETLVDNGPQLNDSDQIKYFETKLYKMALMPLNRFDRDAQSTWFGTDPTAVLREEIDFSRFITRLRSTFSQIILKPLRLELAMKLPNLKNDKRILSAISMQFNSYNQFEEMMNIEVMSRRIEFISSMKDSLVDQDEEGNDVPYFATEFLVQKYLNMTESDLELNRKIKLKNKIKNTDDADKENEEDSDEKGSEDEDLGLGEEDKGESDETEDIDTDMLGDVEPESSKTTSIQK